MHITSDEQTVNKLWTNCERLKTCFPRVYIIYITRRACPVQRLLLKFLIVFPYAIIISNLYDFVKRLRNRSLFRIWRIAQIPNVPYIPNVQDIPNIPDNPAAGFSAVVPIFPRQKVDHRRLYCTSRRMKDIHIYNVYCPAVQSRISSAQKHIYAQTSRNTTSHT